MDVRYIDAHCHVQFDQYAEDSEQVIARMRDEGVIGVVVGCDRSSSERAVALAERNEHLYAAVGLHPNHESDRDLASEVFSAEAYGALANHPKVVAIGECGLDYYRPTEVSEAVKAVQKELFREQIALAALLDKPLVVHTRPSKGSMDAYWDAIEMLKMAKEQYPTLRGDIHFFVGGTAEANAFIALGFTLSFTAVITFARDYDEVLRHVPLSSILSETDAPYVAPLARRGKRNDPLAVVDVVEKIALIRGEDPELVRAALVANSARLYNLPSLKP